MQKLRAPGHRSRPLLGETYFIQEASRSSRRPCPVDDDGAKRIARLKLDSQG